MFVGLAFPPLPFGILACIGFVPFLLLTDAVETAGRFFRYAYATFFLLSLIALYWVGGFTHGKDPYLMIAGMALFLWEPLVLTLPAMIYFSIRKRVPQWWSVLSFPCIWITMEWLYAYGELAFPWLHIGNTQTYQLQKIQFADIAGVYGISLWVLVLNVLVFLFIRHLQSGGTVRRSLYYIAAITLFYVAPDLYQPDVQQSEGMPPVSIGIIQPNIDPWSKWDGSNSFAGRWAQVESYLELIESHQKDSLDIVVLPESAILLNLPQLEEQFASFRERIDRLPYGVVSGYVRVRYYDAATAPLSSNTMRGTNVRYDSFNSVMFVQPGVDTAQVYSKMRLVPFAERIPYAEQMPWLIEPLRWGVGISNWGLLHDSTLFVMKNGGSTFLAMVCYESIFPEFVSSFVKKGAQFLVFTTNDSWWGNTSGARQHSQFAVLRAIENRRWVARCANGGISCFIGPDGRMYDATSMYTTAFIRRLIYPKNELTFYTEHGDWLARICASITLVFFLFSIGYSIHRKLK